MSENEKDDDPTLIPEGELDDVNAGFTKIPDLYSGGKVLDSFIKIDEFATTVTAKVREDMLINSFNTGKKLDRT